jgi:thiamine biosynthesis lipoprotein
VMELVGSRHVVLDPLARTVHFRRPGLELNLGAIGKGYALDRAAELLRREWRMPSGILHGGRSSVLAIGSPPAETAGTGWLVALQHPFDASRQVARLRLRDLALGTSGATVQYFEADGRRFGHILDPRSGWPAAGQVCVSVVAATAAQADALSTAFFISGPDQARAYCARHPEVGAVLVALPRPGAELELTVLGAAQGLVEALVSESEA